MFINTDYQIPEILYGKTAFREVAPWAAWDRVANCISRLIIHSVNSVVDIFSVPNGFIVCAWRFSAIKTIFLSYFSKLIWRQTKLMPSSYCAVFIAFVKSSKSPFSILFSRFCYNATATFNLSLSKIPAIHLLFISAITFAQPPRFSVFRGRNSFYYNKPSKSFSNIFFRPFLRNITTTTCRLLSPETRTDNRFEIPAITTTEPLNSSAFISSTLPQNNQFSVSFTSLVDYAFAHFSSSSKEYLQKLRVLVSRQYPNFWRLFASIHQNFILPQYFYYTP